MKTFDIIHLMKTLQQKKDGKTLDKLVAEGHMRW